MPAPRVDARARLSRLGGCYATGGAREGPVERIGGGLYPRVNSDRHMGELAGIANSKPGDAGSTSQASHWMEGAAGVTAVTCGAALMLKRQWSCPWRAGPECPRSPGLGKAPWRHCTTGLASQQDFRVAHGPLAHSKTSPAFATHGVPSGQAQLIRAGARSSARKANMSNVAIFGRLTVPLTLYPAIWFPTPRLPKRQAVRPE